MLKQYLECGKIVSTHGVRGEVRVMPWCDSPEFLCGFDTLYLQKGETALEILRARPNKNMVLLKLKGFDTLDDAVTLRGKVLYIDRDDAPDDGKSFVQDLMGISVVDADSGRSWGTLTDVLFTGANDVYVLTDENKTQRLVPAIPDVIVETDLTGGVMRIRPLKGLFDED
ncbi:MAG: ribosome maturation factor RimM [Oscillospiraceae bacterium]|nr:ribosome maturation factor RimM [Oscillospiraceae bacterium]